MTRDPAADGPDYTTYPLEELEEVRRILDPEAYPERHAFLLAEIEKRKAGVQPEVEKPPATPTPARKNSRTWFIAAVIVVVLAVLGGGAVVVLQKLREVPEEFGPVLAALVEEYPDEAIEITLVDDELGIIMHADPWTDQDAEARREAARQVAQVALGAHESGSAIGSVMVKTTTEEYRFEASEL